MGLFNRRTSPADASTTSATGKEKHGRKGIMKRRERRQSRSASGDGALHTRPKFGQWLKATWPDLLTMVVMGIIGLGVSDANFTSYYTLLIPTFDMQVYSAPPAPSRSFPVYFQDGEIVYPEFAYPLRPEIVPIWAAALLAALVPITIFLIMQIRIRSFWDVNNAVIGLLYSLITAAVFQVFLKWLIGGLRPHFLGEF